MKIKRIPSLILLSLLVSLFQSLPTANAAGPATQLVLTRPAVGTASGAAFTTQPQITLQDASGNTVTGSALVISIQSFSFSGYMNSLTGAETLIGTQTATIDASTGIATFPADFGISGIAGRTYSFNYYNATVAPASQSITVTVGAASKLILKRASAGTTSGIAFTTQPQISVADSGNNTVTGSTPVITASVSAGGTLAGTTTATVDSGSGVATFNDLGISGTNNNSYTVTYSSTGLAPVAVSIKIGTPTAPSAPSFTANSTTSTNSLFEYNFPAPDNGGSDITSYEYQWVTASSFGAATPTATWITYPAPEIQSGLVILSIDISLLVRAVDPNWNYFLLRTRNAIGASSHGITGYRLGFLGAPTLTTVTLPAPTSTSSIISGATLTNQMTFSGPAPISYTYEWQRCDIFTTSSCTIIVGATNSTYALTDADVGKYVRSRVIATNSYGSSSTGSSSRSSLTSIVLANSGPDITAPTITSINSSTANSTYKAGDVISLQVNFSENVTVTGTPKLTLETGSVDRAVNYVSGTGTNQLTFTYTVQAGDTSADLDYLSTSALDLNGGTIRDAAANNATLTLPAPGAANSLGANKAIVIDTAPPSQTISSIDISTDTGSSATDFITATASQTITGTLSAILRAGESLWGSVDGGANYVDVSSSVSGTAITWLNTTLSGSNSIKFQVRDTSGATGATATQTYVLDTTAPIPTVATVVVISPTAVAVRSSEVGTAYLVKTSVTVSNLASITGAADDSMNQVAIAAAATDTSMSTAGLIPGDYKLYVVDVAGNLSAASSNIVTVGVATAPTVTSTSAPTGSTTFGSTLTNAVTFTGLPTPTLSYQWKSCTNATETATVCADISGANGSSFIANAISLIGKFIRVLVTAVNGVSPDATEWSLPTGAIAPVAPGAPTLGTTTVGDLQISIPVTAPTSDGGSTIVKYQYSTDGGVTWADRTDSATVTSPIVIKYLSTNGTTPIVAGTAYPIQIRAVNSAIPGEGAASTSLSVTAITAPGAPTAVAAVATGQTTATVSFVAPVSNGGSAITTYTVTSAPGGVTASGNASPIFITGLTAATAYTFTVTATNALATSVASAPSIAVTTFSPPIPTPEPICNALCVAAQNAAIKAAADKIIADKAAADKIIADKLASDTAAKIVAERVVVDKTAAEAAAKTAVEKAVAAAVSKSVAAAASAQAATAAKTAADAQLAAVVAAEKAAAALKNPTASAATKAAATKAAAKAATTATNTVKAAATAAKVAATARAAATNAQKQVEIALGALSSKTAAATTTAQANAIAAAAKAAANKAAKAASDQAVSAKAASDIANKEAASASEIIVAKQKLAVDAAAAAKVANDLAITATEEKVTAAAEAQKAAEAVVKLLEEKIALADASVKAKDITERAAIDKKIEEINAKVVDAQRTADAATVKAEATTAAQERVQAAALVATQLAAVQAAEAVAAATDSIAKTAVASKAQAAAKLAANVAKAAVAAAAKVPSRAVIAATSNSSTKKNTATATITGLKPGQKVKVTVNVKGK